MTSVDGRTRHYGDFYGLPPVDGQAPDDRPLLLVWGNCQAEAVRVLLASSASLPYRTVRVPPVFELTATDLPHLDRLLPRVAALVTQPVRDGYRDLPLGSGETAARLAAGAVAVRWPVIRCAALHPFQAIIRDPRDRSREPPVVPYHDLRTLASAVTGLDHFDTPVTADGVRAVGAASLAELARREAADCDLGVSDVVRAPQARDFATINHPGNRLLLALAHRIQAVLGAAGDAVDPGRVLLGSVRAPVEAITRQALGLTGAGSRIWQVDGVALDAARIHREQWRWYLANPWVIEEGAARHRDTLGTLGLL